MILSAKLEEIKGIGPKTAEALEKRGFRTIRDLLYYFPRSYEDYQSQTNIADINPGRVILRGKIRNLRNLHTRRRNFVITQGEIYDDTGAVRVVWYNQPYRIKNFDKQTTYYFTGQYDFKYNRYQITSPTVVAASEIEQKVDGFQPIYSAKGSFNSAWFKKLFEKLRPVTAKVPDLLPLESGPSYLHQGVRSQALSKIHFPKDIEDVKQAKKYLGYEELFELILASQLNRQENQKLKAAPLRFDLNLIKKFLATLPFELTDAQKSVSWEILQDLAKTTPMNRLLQGDVGSGKTIVAAIAILQAVKNGTQVALLAPTAILAAQHAENLEKVLAPFNIRVALLIGATKKKDPLKQQIKDGEIDLIVGTHAILTDDTIFHQLAFCIIDEQHRFGVHQRLMLREKGEKAGFYPHQLIMTATPIPRTLAMTVYADLDTSIIDELPPGRTPIMTVVISEERRDEIVTRVKNACINEKRQAYWVCTLIDESEVLEAQAAEAIWEDLTKALPMLKIGLVHGRMKPQEKQDIMAAFKNAELDLLVATTVIEVGVDVPNASLMIIENAERLGLSQLHQLRGRVGRGNTASFCVLMYKPPLGKVSQKRLQVLRDSQDGFVISEKDLEIRGPGEVLGTKQTGIAEFKVANLMRDRKMIPTVQHYAKALIVKYPDVAESLIRRWLNNREIYSNA